MNIDLVPTATDPDTQWKPFLPGLIFGRRSFNADAATGWVYAFDAVEPRTRTRDINERADTTYYSPSGAYSSCPAPSRKLGEISSAELSKYLNSLKPTGFTYHDIGLIWGLRLMSPTGIFRSEHEAAASGGRISRHLIFMTDGETDTKIGAYDAWGLSAVDRRRTPLNRVPTREEQNELTEDRVTELCTIAKDQMNVTVWVIAFGDEVTLGPMLSNCASPGRAFKAENAAELSATFAEIASQIAALRITH